MIFIRVPYSKTPELHRELSAAAEGLQSEQMTSVPDFPDKTSEIRICGSRLRERANERPQNGIGDGPRRRKNSIGDSSTSSDESNHRNTSNQLVSETLVLVPDELIFQGYLPPDHPARLLAPIDLLFLVDSSSSIGVLAFEQVSFSFSSSR